jgi:hypothetical protein
MPAVQLIVSRGQNRVGPITELVRIVVQETGLGKKKIFPSSTGIVAGSKFIFPGSGRP